jgi:hypothetical protein
MDAQGVATSSGREDRLDKVEHPFAARLNRRPRSRASYPNALPKEEGSSRIPRLPAILSSLHLKFFSQRIDIDVRIESSAHPLRVALAQRSAGGRICCGRIAVHDLVGFDQRVAIGCEDSDGGLQRFALRWAWQSEADCDEIR